MRIMVIDRQQRLGARHQEFLQRRVLFALARFDSKIERVTVRVRGSEAPPAKTETATPPIECQVAVCLRNQDRVVVSIDDSDVRRCIARAANRAGRSVALRVSGGQPIG